MKKTVISNQMKLLIISFIIFCIVGVVSFSIPTSFPDSKVTDKTVKEPYYIPDTSQFLLYFSDTKRIIEIDYENLCTHILDTDTKCDKYINIPDQSLIKIIDRFGGVETSLPFILDGFDNLPRRYTGTQILEILSMQNLNKHEMNSFKTDIVLNILKNISILGFSNEDFQYIMNLTDSNISYIDFYDVSSYIADCFGNTDFFESEVF